MRRFLVSSLLLHICALVDPSRKSTGWFVVASVVRGHHCQGGALSRLELGPASGCEAAEGGWLFL